MTAHDVADAGFHTVPPIQPPPGRGGQEILVPERPVLAGERERFVGVAKGLDPRFRGTSVP